MGNVVDHKCPNCNAVLKFNPHGQNWKCEYCKGTFLLEDITKSEKDEINYKKISSQNNDGIDIYSCPNCGAEIIADSNTSTTSCVYCRNTAILKDKLQGEFSPNYVIPFKHTKEDAVKAFKSLIKKKKLAPAEFSNKNNIKEMSGIYIPFWLYDYQVDGSIEADCKKITTWRSGNYQYTKTDTFLAVRDGSLTLNNVPTDGSKRFSNDIMNSIEPFDYSDLKKFNYSYLSGFLSEKYDISKEEASEEAASRAKSSFISQLKSDISKYNVVNVTKDSVKVSTKSSNYALLPVWMLNIKYKDKIYTFAMNGQTGKLVGNIPVDKGKAILAFVLSFAFFFTAVFAVAYFGVIL